MRCSGHCVLPREPLETHLRGAGSGRHRRAANPKGARPLLRQLSRCRRATRSTTTRARSGRRCSGKVPDRILTPHPRFARDRWPERLQGHAVRSVDAHGKHLFIRFANGLTIHSHLRMTGKWRVRGLDYKPPRNTWLLIYAGERQVAQINGPILELMTDSRARFDRRLAVLGPDILAPELDEERILRRLREDDPTRPIGDALLDQRILAGIGNLWKVEGCFGWPRSTPGGAPGTCPTTRCCAILEETRPRMQQSAPGRHAGRSPDDLRPRPASPARAAARKINGHSGRATTTGRHTGVQDVSTEAHRTQGRGPDRPRQHAGVVRRGAGSRRGHDRVRRPARERARAGQGPFAARARLRAPRRRADARRGPRPPGELPVRARRARRGPQAPRLRGARGRGAARVRPGRAHADLDDVDALADRPARAGTAAAPRLERPAPAQRPDAVLGDQAPRLRRRGLRPRQAAELREGAHQRRPLRRGDVALAARLPAPGARRSRRPAASSTCGRSTTARGSAGSRSSASPGSSPTTRGCSLSFRARRWRRNSPPGRPRRWSWCPASVATSDVLGQRVPAAPAELDDAAQRSSPARSSRR